MDNKYILVGLIALLIGLLIPLIGYNTLPSGQIYIPETTRTPQIGPVFGEISPWNESAGLKLDNLYVFNSYTELFNTIHRYASTQGTGGVIPESLLIYKGPYLTYTPLALTATAGIESGTRESYGGEASPSSYSTTNVQVEGVEEGDIVKTNGRIIVEAVNDKIYIIDAEHDTLAKNLSYTDTYIVEIYLVGDNLVVIGVKFGNERIIKIQADGGAYTVMIPSYNTTVNIYDMSNPYNPVVKHTFEVSGLVVSTRFTNDTLYVVSSAPVAMDGNVIVPMVNNMLLYPREILLVPTGSMSLSQYTVITAINILDGSFTKRAFLSGSASRIYMSHKHLVVITTSGAPWFPYASDALWIATKYVPKNVSDKMITLLNKHDISGARRVFEEYLTKLSNTGRSDEVRELINNINIELTRKQYSYNTTLYVFNVNGLNLEYKGKFSVKGRILDQFAVEEYRGKYLIVATTYNTYVTKIRAYFSTYIEGLEGGKTITVIEDGHTKTYEIPAGEAVRRKRVSVYFETNRVIHSNLLTIFDLDNMSIAGKLDNIAGNEDIYAARLVGDLFMLVTFRRIDPLFAINISDPYNPEIVGFLEIPGYMDYLHPISRNILLGLGADRDRLVIRLYDISDPRDIKVLSELVFKDTGSPALKDYHAIMFNPSMEKFYIPISRYAVFTRINTWCSVCIGAAAISYEGDKLVVDDILWLKGASRILYIDDKLYVASPSMIKIYDIQSYEEIGEIKLP